MTMTAEWRRRVEAWLAVLKERSFYPLGEVAVATVTAEQLSAEQAAAGPFEPLEPGTAWGGMFCYLWLRGSLTLPDAAAGRRVVLRLGGDADCLVWVDGRIAGSHGWAASPITLSRAASPHTRHELLIEASSGYPEARWWQLLGRGPRYAGDPVGIADYPPAHRVVPPLLGIWREELYQLAIDMQTLLELRDGLPAGELWPAEIDRGLMEASLICDPELEEPGLLETAAAARERLRPLLERTNAPGGPTLYLIGHGHLDIAWLWPLAETRRKMARTMANQLALCEEYPAHRFLQSQPYLYEMLRESYPELYERVLAQVRAGRIVADGAMYVEADTNLSGGESLIRQILRGRSFFSAELGVESSLLWLPDVFGYSGALPQIMRGCGIGAFATQKITWAYGGSERFPLTTFLWEGIDGSAVTAHIFSDYNSETRPQALLKRWQARAQQDDGVRSMIVAYGWGDGGGGPNRDHLEFLGRAADLQGLPRARIAPPAEFFADLERDGPPQARYVGELYFQAHRGTYTSQARTKALNRRCELALRAAELWGCAARALAGRPYGPRDLDPAWGTVLLNQFHDILPGSSIGRVYAEAEAAYAAALEQAEQAARAAAGALTDGDQRAATVFNSLPWPRRALVALPAGWAAATDSSGAGLPAQPVGDQLLAEVALPACGWATLRPAPAPGPAGAEGSRISAPGDGSFVLENGLIRAAISPRGELTSLIDKHSGLETMAGPGNRLRLYKDVPIWFDAWDIDRMAEQQPVPTDEPVTLEALESGPLLARLRLRRRLGHSTVEQIISLARGSRRLTFASEIDWRERHRLLKVDFPTTMHANEAIHEIQFGHIRRPNHRSHPRDADRYEVCNQRWSALAEEGRGLAVLNDSKYGISSAGGTLSLTLLKSALGPDEQADQGRQRFSYAVYLWQGSLLESGVVAEAYALNEPPLLAPGAARGDGSLLSVDRANIVIETVKPAEDGSADLIVRLYEAGRSRTRCRLTAGLPLARAAACDMLERELAELPIGAGGIELELAPFEIQTIRLRPADS